MCLNCSKMAVLYCITVPQYTALSHLFCKTIYLQCIQHSSDIFLSNSCCNSEWHCFFRCFFAKLHFLIIQSGTLKTVLFLLYFVFPLNVCKKYYIKTSNYGFNFILLQILQYLKWTQWKQLKSILSNRCLLTENACKRNLKLYKYIYKILFFNLFHLAQFTGCW